MDLFFFNFVFVFTIKYILPCLCHAALWSPAGKGLTSWLSWMWCFSSVFVTFGTWLYRFLIFFPTLNEAIERITWLRGAFIRQIWHLYTFPCIRYNWAATWDFQQCDMCDQQMLIPACAYAQSDQNLCKSFEYSLTVNILTETEFGVSKLKRRLHRRAWVYSCQ